MLSDVPPIFSPRVLRKKTVYNDLSQRLLSVSEKTFLGTEAANLSTSLDFSPSPISKLTQLSDRYRLSYTTVKNWSEKVKLNRPISSELGRPPSMDKIAGETFVETLLQRRAAKNCVPLHETLSLLGQGVTAMKMRQGKRGSDAISSICVTTQKNCASNTMLLDVSHKY
jgi:hypothetical protein